MKIQKVNEPKMDDDEASSIHTRTYGETARYVVPSDR